MLSWRENSTVPNETVKLVKNVLEPKDLLVANLMNPDDRLVVKEKLVTKSLFAGLLLYSS